MTIRSEETKAKLQQAFTTLLQEKSYETITMADVAQQAQRARSTLYHHYPNQEMLLLDCFSNTIEEIKDMVTYPTNFPNQGVSPIAFTNLTIFYTHVADHRYLYQALFLSSASPIVRVRFRRVIAGILLHVTQQAGSLTNLPASPSMVSNLLAEMIIGAAVWWLDTKPNQYEPAMLAEIVVRLAERGLFGLNGQAPIESDLSYQPFVSPQPS